MQERGVYECQAWQQTQALLFPKRTESAICVNLLEQTRELESLEIVEYLQNLRPAKVSQSYCTNTEQNVNTNKKRDYYEAYPASHVKGSPENSPVKRDILRKLFNVLASSARKHGATSRENEVFTFPFHPSLVTFPVSNFIIWHICMPNLQVQTHTQIQQSNKPPPTTQRATFQGMQNYQTSP